jgi:hypothetical protein
LCFVEQRQKNKNESGTQNSAGRVSSGGTILFQYSYSVISANQNAQKIENSDNRCECPNSIESKIPFSIFVSTGFIFALNKENCPSLLFYTCCLSFVWLTLEMIFAPLIPASNNLLF